MIRILFLMLSILVAGWLAQFVLPWYGVAIVAGFLGLLFRLSPAPSFVAGFVGAFLLWGISAWILNQANEGVLAGRMGILFGGLSPIIMLFLSALIGGLLGGLGALTGSLFPLKSLSSP